MTFPEPTDGGDALSRPDLESLIPILRRVVGARVSNSADAEDIVQETLSRVLGAVHRIDPELLAPYAIRTARNLVTNSWRGGQRLRRIEHLLVDTDSRPDLDDHLLVAAESATLSAGLAELSAEDRGILLAHYSLGEPLTALAERTGRTPGAMGARLHRIRAKMRVHYWLAQELEDPPTDRCFAVLLSISARDARRQREADAEGHLLECDFCARVVGPNLEHSDEDTVVVNVMSDPDIVEARQAVRQMAAQLGFGPTDQTLISTAVSEVARNIVRFADRGRITVEARREQCLGLRVIARDAGPGIQDLDAAMKDGFSTYAGLGLGLPGARRLMDEFEVRTVAGRGTTITMTKWLPGGLTP
ncbi:sigma-70 family RNA polymerase sigma factor [Ammonicoccus fulvus]|uniref:Sigma-70 family RNA polymerase sigma factor n=1 Tax=Ammonicoccus fulvus TaxID=3138240 RepID=A0ABZ3FSV8_9ACTN